MYAPAQGREGGKREDKRGKLRDGEILRDWRSQPYTWEGRTKPLKSNQGGFFRATGSLTLRTSTYGVTGSSCSPKEKAKMNTQELSRNCMLVGTWGLLGEA